MTTPKIDLTRWRNWHAPRVNPPRVLATWCFAFTDAPDAAPDLTHIGSWKQAREAALAKATKLGISTVYLLP